MGGQEKEKTCNPATVEYQLSRWRSILELIRSQDFKDLFAQHGTKQVQELIDLGNLGQLREWVKTVKHGPLAHKSVEELRKMAGKLGIRYYGKMSKSQLLVEITRRKPNVE